MKKENIVSSSKTETVSSKRRTQKKVGPYIRIVTLVPRVKSTSLKIVEET